MCYFLKKIKQRERDIFLRWGSQYQGVRFPSWLPQYLTTCVWYSKYQMFVERMSEWLKGNPRGKHASRWSHILRLVPETLLFAQFPPVSSCQITLSYIWNNRGLSMLQMSGLAIPIASLFCKRCHQTGAEFKIRWIITFSVTCFAHLLTGRDFLLIKIIFSEDNTLLSLLGAA